MAPNSERAGFIGPELYGGGKRVGDDPRRTIQRGNAARADAEYQHCGASHVPCPWRGVADVDAIRAECSAPL